jgi:uncharacterized protein YcnI
MRNKMLLTAALLLAPVCAFAHVSLADNSAAPGAQFVAHFKVGHGCDGSPTTALDIAIPDGVTGVAAMTVSGWALQKSPDGKRIGWKGGSLDAKTPGEFAVAMTLPAKPGPLVFAATQTCATGVESWSDVPQAGVKSTHPAPILYVGVPAPKKDDMKPGMVMAPGSHM